MPKGIYEHKVYTKCLFCDIPLGKSVYKNPYCGIMCKQKDRIQRLRKYYAKDWNVRKDGESEGKWVISPDRWEQPYGEICEIFSAIGVKFPTFEDSKSFHVALGEHPTLGVIHVEMQTVAWAREKNERYKLEWVQCLASPGVKYVKRTWQIYSRCLYQTREALVNADTGAVDADFIPTNEGLCGCRGCIMGRLLTKLQVEGKFNFVYKGHWHEYRKWQEWQEEHEEWW